MAVGLYELKTIETAIKFFGDTTGQLLLEMGANNPMKLTPESKGVTSSRGSSAAYHKIVRTL